MQSFVTFLWLNGLVFGEVEVAMIVYDKVLRLNHLGIEVYAMLIITN